MQKIGIIGASGLLGNDLQASLQKKFKVTGITKDNYSSHVGDAFDILINANGNSKRFWANQHIIEDFTASTISVYKSIFDFKFKKYIYISSSDVYENHTAKKHTSEEQKINSDNLPPYGLHKYLSEKIVANNTDDYIILRSSMILGKKLRKGPIFDILNNQELFITLDSKLQMIATTEIASIIEYLISNNVSNQTFNMGGKGIVDFKDTHTYFKQKIKISEKAETQLYEMNVDKLSKIFPLKTSSIYLQSFLKSI